MAFSDNPKAQANRQLKCQNDQKNTCCYLCTFRSQCTISCKYLGQTGTYTGPKTVAEPENEPTETKTLEAGTNQFENVPVSFCFSCNVEMAWTKTQLNIDSWHGPKPALASEKMLPITVYVCPKCGKTEFKADITKSEAKQ
jgi:hypothetical protein